MAFVFEAASGGGHGDDWPIWPAAYSIVVSVSFLLFAAIRLWQFRCDGFKVKPNGNSHIKVVAALAFLALQLSSLVRYSLASKQAFDIQLFSDIVSSVSALGFCVLSFVEQRLSATPSTLLVLYMLACALGHASELLILPLKHDREMPFFLTIHVFLELALVVLECQDKDSVILPEYQQLTPEERASVLGRTFFWWINPILMKGHRWILTDADLPPTGQKLSSSTLRRDVLRSWDHRVKPEQTNTLPYVLFDCFKRPLIIAVLPRLFLITFRYSQAVLINIAVKHIINIPKDSATRDEDGHWLIVEAFIVYVGMATSKAVYRHQLNRLKVMFRGGLISLIHERALHVRNAYYEDGNALTLMSTDADNLQLVVEMFHDTWAYLLEVIIGTTFLATQIGWLCPVPLVIIFFCSHVSRWVAKHLEGKQRAWSVATQKRIAMTISMLASAKSIKMLGISEAIQSKVQGLRVYEIDMSKRLRWMMVGSNASANALGIFTPAITLVLFAIIAKSRGDGSLDVSTAFTTIAVLTMVTRPANMLMTIWPRAAACMANFERIQRYLLDSTRQDNRLDVKKSVLEIPSSETQDDNSRYALVANKISVQYASSLQPILQDINFKVEAGSFWILSGRVGSGKTTLAQILLGEVTPSSGSMAVSTRCIAWCSQIPWLPSLSIKEVICGESDFDPSWYNTVVYACALEQDLDRLPHRDETLIGSRGVKLSGGQRQRVALARAVYARCDITVLDDPCSALDGATEHHIIENLLGPSGLLRRHGQTVCLITTDVQHYSLADQIVILGNARIQFQGTADDILHSSSPVLKTIIYDKQMKRDNHLDELEVKKLAQTTSNDDAALNVTRKTGDLAVYGYYFKNVGILNCIFLVCCTASYSFFLMFSQYWVKWWTESRSDRTWFYVGGYLLFAFIAWSATNGIQVTTIIRIAPHSGIVFHFKLLKAIIRAPLSFYSKSEIGTLLNRFSQDIQFVDKKLPPALNSLSVQTFKLFMQAIILSIIQKPILVTLPFATLVVYFVQKVYLRTSRQLRFLELESVSAVYSSFLETVDGITTIRAFGWQKRYEAENIAMLDISQSPFYLLLCLQRWLSIVLDLLVAGIAIGVISLAISLKGTMTGGQIGVALNMILLANTTLLRLIESYTNLEISLGAIARLKETIEKTPQEDGPEGGHTIEGWPSAGAVKVDQLDVSYIPGKLALTDVSLEVEAGQRLILCGRTGSGKSTLVLSLLRLLDQNSGSVTVDGFDISHTTRSAVRQTCFIAVPQDPFLLADATLRFNVDPMEHYSDAEIMTALEKTQLWAQFSQPRENGQPTVSNENQLTTRLDAEHVLDSTLKSLPQLSTGQQQLLSLARAVLRAQPPARTVPYRDDIMAQVKTKPILLLDEATSSLDKETEAMIYEIIQQEFTDKGHTVIAISHRLGALKKGWKKGRDVLVRMVDGRVEDMGDLSDVVGEEVEDGDLVKRGSSGSEGEGGSGEVSVVLKGGAG